MLLVALLARAGGYAERLLYLLGQRVGSHVSLDFTAHYGGYHARLFAYDDGENIVVLLGDADSGAVTRAQLFSDIDLLRQGQEAACGEYLVALDNYGAVVQRREC